LYEYGNGTNASELNARHVDWLGRDAKGDQNRLDSSIFQGTLVVNAKFLSKQPFWDNESLRRSTPTARFGNLMVFRGTCACGAILAPGFYFDAESKIYAEKPNLLEAERLLRQSIALDPSAFFAHMELGNLLLKRGAREDPLRVYSEALRHAPNDPVLRRPIEEQIKRVSSEPLDHIPVLRNPFLE
jgi:tetratricopeptide (TPR) repeat protein